MNKTQIDLIAEAEALHGDTDLAQAPRACRTR